VDLQEKAMPTRARQMMSFFMFASMGLGRGWRFQRCPVGPCPPRPPRVS
jgi:hypothetical protein